jgi:hypothetical protein
MNNKRHFVTFSLVVKFLLVALCIGTCAISTALIAPKNAQAQGRTTNPYNVPGYGPPNCTWYAWQRLHDVEHLDLQFSANANEWINLVQEPDAVWSETSNSYVQVQISLTPAAGDIVVLPFASSWAHPYHVAFVESGLNPSGSFLVSEQSYGDYSPGIHTTPYPYVTHAVWPLNAMQQAEQGHARFLHFPGVQLQPTGTLGTSTDGSQWIANSPNVVVEPGMPFSANFIFENSGTTTWSDSSGYALRCDTFYHHDSNCMGGNSVGFNGQKVPPGQQYNFTVALVAPSSTGTYTTWWDMTHNGGIFGNNNVAIQVTVQGSSPTPNPTSTPTNPTPTPTNPPTPVDNSQWISNSPPQNVQPGQQFTVQFTYKNNGNTTWSDGNGYALSCDTFYHSNSNCMGSSSVGFGGGNVAPGQQFTFNVTLIAPSSSGTYYTYWDMTHNGGIFGNNNSYVQVNVQLPPPQVDNSQWISNSPTQNVLPGQQFTIQFTYKNDGTTTWSDGGGYALSCDMYYHGNNNNCMGSGSIGLNGQSIQPGQQYTFTLNLTAPSSTGTYYTWWDMTHNGGIFGNNNSYVQVNVQAPVDNSQWVSNSSPQNVQPGQQFTIQFTYENDGTTTWSDGGGYALSCDMYYHGNNNNCMGGGPVGLSGRSIGSGQQITFTFALTAPSTPGTYYTWWDMTHNGGIFGNNNSYVIVYVQ